MPDRQHEITLRFLAEPIDVNLYGNVHGGSVMKWIDQAGYACAVGWSGQFCVTVYVGGIQFYQPIHIGHLVEVRARLMHTGRTSMHISVEVSAADPRDGILKRTTGCVVVFVAIDSQTRPIPVPAWTPRTPEQIALQQHAIKLMEWRKGMEGAGSKMENGG
ncbi:MAG TPA: acyl-CoA thioesterase [Humisphaera sp.]|jgi:acyl-CoA hydrolase|nr:acyl-CoA thioesterase [Humisphaera sp.]